MDKVEKLVTAYEAYAKIVNILDSISDKSVEKVAIDVISFMWDNGYIDKDYSFGDLAMCMESIGK